MGGAVPIRSPANYEEKWTKGFVTNNNTEKKRAGGRLCFAFLSFFLFLHCVVNIFLFSNKKTVLGALLDPPGLSIAILSSGEY